MILIGLFIIILVIEILFYWLYQAIEWKNNIVYILTSVSIPVFIVLYYLYKKYDFSTHNVFLFLVVYILVVGCVYIKNNPFLINSIKAKIEKLNFSSITKSIIEKAALFLYILGLLGFPIYKLFIARKVTIDGLFDLWLIFLAFLFYLVCWWFIFTPVCWIIASFFFLKGNDAKDMRYGCGFPALFVVILITCGTIYEKCSNKSTPKSNAHGLYTPTQSARENKDNSKKGVYICTGPQSKRYHCSRYCRGLESCSDDIEFVDFSEAEN